MNNNWLLKILGTLKNRFIDNSFLNNVKYFVPTKKIIILSYLNRYTN